MSRTYLPGRADTCKRLAHDVAQWRNGHGNVILIRGEAGMGKSETLRWLAEEIGEASVRIDCRPPIGNFNVSTIQPLQPFGNAIEQLYVQSEQAAKKRLAMNIGMSLLASIPIAGDIFYAVKAISQDVSEYKRDTSAMQQKKRAAVDECVDTLMRIAEQRPVALLIDDAHWSDSQSVEVLRHILPRIGELPLLIVWAIDPASCRRVNVSLTGLLQEGSFHERTLTLSALSADGMHEMVKTLVPQAAFTDREWSLLHDRTAGCPGVIREYISYLQQTSQILADGSLVANALDVPGLSGSSHPATDVALHAVADADATVLTLAAAEGREFTAFVLAALMNTDVLTAIRTLRGIAQRTGLIKSLGMRTRYGVKTTVYTFTQSVAYTHFLHYAEYEERKHLHQRISEILSHEYAATELDEVRQQIAGFIAAHSMEAEDVSTVERMLRVSAESADTMGASDVSTFIRTSLLADYAVASQSAATVSTSEAVSIDDAASIAAGTPIRSVIRSIADAIVRGDAAAARTLVTAALGQSERLMPAERATLLILAARAYVEESRWTDAEGFLDEVDRMSDLSDHERCMMLNVRATIALRQQDTVLARTILYEASRIAQTLPVSTRIVTLGNILLTLRAMGDSSVVRYERSLRRLMHARGWSGMRTDLAM